MTHAGVAASGAEDHRSDGALTQAVRRGDIAAYGVLYARHLGAARRVAATWAATHAEREDVIAEAFTRVLQTLRSGGGPDELFWPYLAATIRNTVISWRRQDSIVSLCADASEVADTTAEAGETAIVHRLHAATPAAVQAVDAFASLPLRWRTVLWHTEIEGATPADLAPRFGLTPNGVAALAYRARQGLRKAYRTQHLRHPNRRTSPPLGSVAQLPRRNTEETRDRTTTTRLGQLQPSLACDRYAPEKKRPDRANLSEVRHTIG